MPKKYSINKTGGDVQPAKGNMFESLEDVARYLQKNNIKIDAPNDENMVQVLNKYGVLNNPIGKYTFSI